MGRDLRRFAQRDVCGDVPAACVDGAQDLAPAPAAVGSLGARAQGGAVETSPHVRLERGERGLVHDLDRLAFEVRGEAVRVIVHPCEQ